MRILKLHYKRFVTCGSILPAVAGFALAASAQTPMVLEHDDWTPKSEFYGIGQYLHSEDIHFNSPQGPVNMKMDDTGLGGFGMAYHFNEHLGMHLDFMFGGATFSGDVPLMGGGTAHVNQDAFLQTGRLNLDYNLLKGSFTPFVTAGIGYQYLETELKNVPPVAWWDPWYGWQVGQPYVWETDFTWNVGAGVHWNITSRMFLKATVGATWLDYSRAQNITTQLEGILAIGWRY
jgi:opacity protein-like surface antigen